MLEYKKEQYIAYLENSLRLQIAILKDELENTIMSSYDRLKLYHLQNEIVHKERDLKNLKLGNYQKLHYPVARFP